MAAGPALLKIGAWAPVTDTFVAHVNSPTGAVFDLNDGTTFSIQDPSGAKGTGLNLELLEPTVLDVGNPRVVGSQVTTVQYVKNREVAVTLFWGQGSTYSTWNTAIHNLQKLCRGITRTAPAALLFQPTNASTPTYYDILEAHPLVPYEEVLWAQLAQDGVVLKLTCKPFGRGNRQWLQNLAFNPGFEQPGGPAVTVFSDNFTSVNAYQSGYATAVQQDSPVRYYRLGEAAGATTAVDTMASGFNMTAATVTFGIAGAITNDSNTAASVVGTGTMNAVMTGLPSGANAWTLAAWVNLPSTGHGTQTIVGMGDANVAHGAAQITVSNTGTVIFTDGTASTAASAALSTGAWHYLAVTYDGVTIRGYIDGAVGNTVAATCAIAGGGKSTIACVNNNGSLTQDFYGSVDEVAFYTTTLSAARIASLYLLGPNPISQMAYRDEIMLDSPLSYQRMGFNLGFDQAGSYFLNPVGGVTSGQTGAIKGDSDQATLFNGTTGYLTNGGAASTFPTGNAAWTILAWAKPTNNTNASDGLVVAFGNFGTNGQWAGIAQAAGGGWKAMTGGGDTATAGSSTAGTYALLAATWDGTTLTINVNGGTATATATPGARNLVENGYTIGAGLNGSTAQNFFPGTVDEVAIYNGALSAARIQTLYQIGTLTDNLGTTALSQDKATYADSVSTDSPTRYYRLDETSGTVAYDATTNAINGTLAGGITQNVAGALTGDTDTAYTFNGTNARVTTTSTTGLPTGNGTCSLEGWIKITANPSISVVPFGFGDSTIGGHYFQVVMNSSGKVFGDGANNSTGQSAALTLNVWHYIALTWDGTTLRLYVDNNAALTGTGGTATFTYQTTSFAIASGSQNAGISWFPGSVDEVAVYSTALSAARVTAHYNAGTNSPSVSISNSVIVPAESEISFGSPAWGPINTWTVRFRYMAGLEAAFYGKVDGVGNTLGAQVTGSKLSLVNGGQGLLATQAITLISGIHYWIKWNQFPVANPSTNIAEPYVQAILYADNNGVIGTALWSIAPTKALFITLTGVFAAATGNMAIAASGTTLSLGGVATGDNVVALFGPGNWYFTQAGTGLASAAWDQVAANTYPGGPITSAGAARVDVAPAGTLNAQWQSGDTTSAATILSTGMPVQTAGDVLGVSAWLRSTGLNAACTQRLTANEYDKSGAFLRSGTIASLTGTHSSWTQLSGTYTTGASCARVILLLVAVDTATPGESAGGVIWWDNVLVWDQTQTGMSTMPYNASRFGPSPATLTFSGLLGDTSAPAILCLGANPTLNGSTQTSLSIIAGRRAQSNSGMQLAQYSSPSQGFPIGAITLDGKAYGGFTVGMNSNNTQLSDVIPFPLTTATGQFKAWWRGSLTAATPTAVSMFVQQLETVTGSQSGAATSAVSPFATTGAVVVADLGLIVMPFAPNSLLFDPTQTASGTLQYAPYISSGMTWTSAMSNALLMLPIDAEWFATTLSTGSSGYGSWWWWLYWDGVNRTTSYNQSSSATAPFVAPFTSLVAPVVNSGAYVLPSIQVAGIRDPQVDPTQCTTTSQTNVGVNQWGIIAYDSAGNLASVAVDLIYSPVYLLPQ